MSEKNYRFVVSDSGYKQAVIKVPVIPWEEMENPEKGRAGEKFVEFCLSKLRMKKNVDFRSYPRSGRGKNYPDFSDGVRDDTLTFEIEVKNLTPPTTEVTRQWIEENVFSRYSGDASDEVCVIFGGKKYPRAEELLKEKTCYFSREKQIVFDDYLDAFPWMVNSLLSVPSIRRRGIASILRDLYVEVEELGERKSIPKIMKYSFQKEGESKGEPETLGVIELDMRKEKLVELRTHETGSEDREWRDDWEDICNPYLEEAGYLKFSDFKVVPMSDTKQSN